MVIVVICVVLTVFYAVLIGMYRQWFVKVPLFDENVQAQPQVGFTVIIPARNEAACIAECLQSVLSQQYPPDLFEVILVDDHSTDNTAELAAQLQQTFPNLTILNLQQLLNNQKLNSYKKKAIETAIQYSTKDWIVTTDADCMIPPTWLQQFNAFIQQHEPVFIAAPVSFHHTGSFVSTFQQLDFMTLQGITAATVHHGFHSMCNGANLAYQKKAFAAVGGFKGVDHIASGDDMLLMHKIYKRYSGKVGFLLAKNAIVLTQPMHSWKAFFNQRIRWASKADKFEDKRIFTALLLVYLYNLSFLVIIAGAFFFPWLWQLLLGMLLVKTLIDLHFVWPVSRFFGKTKLLWWLPVMQPFHIAYTIIAGILGKFGKYSWKGRTVK